MASSSLRSIPSLVAPSRPKKSPSSRLTPRRQSARLLDPSLIGAVGQENNRNLALGHVLDLDVVKPQQLTPTFSQEKRRSMKSSVDGGSTEKQTRERAPILQRPRRKRQDLLQCEASQINSVPGSPRTKPLPAGVEIC